MTIKAYSFGTRLFYVTNLLTLGKRQVIFEGLIFRVSSLLVTAHSTQ